MASASSRQNFQSIVCMIIPGFRTRTVCEKVEKKLVFFFYCCEIDWNQRLSQHVKKNLLLSFLFNFILSKFLVVWDLFFFPHWMLHSFYNFRQQKNWMTHREVAWDFYKLLVWRCAQIEAVALGMCLFVVLNGFGDSMKCQARRCSLKFEVPWILLLKILDLSGFGHMNSFVVISLHCLRNAEAIWLTFACYCLF